jgi:hypothetical protein
MQENVMNGDDREGKLGLTLLDVLGDRLVGRASVILRHQVLTDNQVFNNLDASKRITITNLFGSPQGLYRLEVDPLAYLPTSQFVNLKASAVTDIKITFAVDPNKVKSVQFPEYSTLPGGIKTLLENSDNVLSFEGKRGEELYKALDDTRRANVLNLTTKSAVTPLGDGKTVLPFIQTINEIRGDRFFVVAPKELRQETKNAAVAGLFNPAPDILHTPPPGFDRAGSFKTPDKYGNLQLTFFLNGDDLMVDIDIDPASGLEHLFQVIEHTITGIQTHPYAVREILIAHQEIDPGYRFAL